MALNTHHISVLAELDRCRLHRDDWAIAGRAATHRALRELYNQGLVDVTQDFPYGPDRMPVSVYRMNDRGREALRQAMSKIESED